MDQAEIQMLVAGIAPVALVERGAAHTPHVIAAARHHSGDRIDRGDIRAQVILQVERGGGAAGIGDHHTNGARRGGQVFADFADRGDAIGDGVVLLEEARAGKVGDAAGGGVGTIKLIRTLALEF